MQLDHDRLRAIPPFSELSDEDLEKLASWLTVEDVSEGRRLTPEGAAGYQFYVIETGTAEVRQNQDGRRSPDRRRRRDLSDDDLRDVRHVLPRAGGEPAGRRGRDPSEDAGALAGPLERPDRSEGVAPYAR